MPDENRPPVFRVDELEVKFHDVPLSQEPEIFGDVKYTLNFKLSGDPADFDLDITGVNVDEVSGVTDENGNPVHMSPSREAEFKVAAYDFFWRRGLHHAEEKVLDHLRGV
jgi:hypothetical protein